MKDSGKSFLRVMPFSAGSPSALVSRPVPRFAKPDQQQLEDQLKASLRLRAPPRCGQPARSRRLPVQLNNPRANFREDGRALPRRRARRRRRPGSADDSRQIIQDAARQGPERHRGRPATLRRLRPAPETSRTAFRTGEKNNFPGPRRPALPGKHARHFPESTPEASGTTPGRHMVRSRRPLVRRPANWGETTPGHGETTARRGRLASKTPGGLSGTRDRPRPGTPPALGGIGFPRPRASRRTGSSLDPRRCKPVRFKRRLLILYGDPGRPERLRTARNGARRRPVSKFCRSGGWRLRWGYGRKGG